MLPPKEKKKINAIFVFDGSGARSLCTKWGGGDYKLMMNERGKVVMSKLVSKGNVDGSRYTCLTAEAWASAREETAVSRQSSRFVEIQ